MAISDIIFVEKKGSFSLFTRSIWFIFLSLRQYYLVQVHRVDSH